MSIQTKVLVDFGSLTTTPALFYTSNKVTTILDKVTATNPVGSNEAVYLWLVPRGGSPGDANSIAIRGVLGGETSEIYEMEGHALSDGEMVYAKASVAGVLTLRITGRVIG